MENINTVRNGSHPNQQFVPEDKLLDIARFYYCQDEKVSVKYAHPGISNRKYESPRRLRRENEYSTSKNQKRPTKEATRNTG